MTATAVRTSRSSDQTQMNVRIDRTLKERGDVALAKAGFTPSQAVRAVWEFAAAHERDPEAIANALAPEGSALQQEEQEARSQAAFEEHDLIVRMLSELSDRTRERRKTAESPSAGDLDVLSYKELRERMYLDRLEEQERA